MKLDDRHRWDDLIFRKSSFNCFWNTVRVTCATAQAVMNPINVEKRNIIRIHPLAFFVKLAVVPCSRKEIIKYGATRTPTTRSIHVEIKMQKRRIRNCALG